MNKREYEDAKRALMTALRNEDYPTVWAIRRLIVAFYNPKGI